MGAEAKRYLQDHSIPQLFEVEAKIFKKLNKYKTTYETQHKCIHKQ